MILLLPAVMCIIKTLSFLLCVRVYVELCAIGLRVCVCACVRAYVRACVRACVCVCVRACVRVCVTVEMRSSGPGCGPPLVCVKSRHSGLIANCKVNQEEASFGSLHGSGREKRQPRLHR